MKLTLAYLCRLSATVIAVVGDTYGLVAPRLIVNLALGCLYQNANPGN